MSYPLRCSETVEPLEMVIDVAGKTIADLIDQSGRTQTEIADACERNRSAVSRWKADNAVSADCYDSFAEAVGVTAREVREISEALESRRSDEPDTLERENMWLKLVRQSQLSLVAKAILYALLDQRHPTTGVSAESDEELAERAGLDPDQVAGRWDEVLSSPFAERIGTNRYTVRLKFP